MPNQPELVDERIPSRWCRPSAAGQGLFGQRALDAVDDPAVVIRESLAGDPQRRGSGRLDCDSECPEGIDDEERLLVI